ncbi:MAG: acyl-CoA reductase, partial [Myxococcota bacterium]|nr:acyl-CoA reductase [Myxococcota bacterium]
MGADTHPDQERIDAVLEALHTLRAQDAGPLSQGLGASNARRCLDLACEAITTSGLQTALATPGARPSDITLVCASGVFTAPLEWAALYAAAGCRLDIKAPAQAPRFCQALALALSGQGLPTHCSTDRRLGTPEVIVAFGDDDSVQAIATENPDSRHVLYGHRFSVAAVQGEPTRALAEALVEDHTLYDTRGCMAPTAVFVNGSIDPWVETLALAMDQAQANHPRGSFDPSLGPEWRRRTGLARIRGVVFCEEASHGTPTVRFRGVLALGVQPPQPASCRGGQL